MEVGPRTNFLFALEKAGWQRRRGDSVFSLLEGTLLPGPKVSQPPEEGGRWWQLLGTVFVEGETRALPSVAFGITSATTRLFSLPPSPWLILSKIPSISQGFHSISLT